MLDYEKSRLLIVLLLAIFDKNFAQDLDYYNTNQSLISLNPSFAGSNGGIRNQLSYLNRWPQWDEKSIFFSNSIDGYIKKINAGISLTTGSNSQYNAITTNEVALAYAQHLSFMDNKLKIITSLQIDYLNSRIDARSLTFGGFIGPFSGGYYMPVPPTTMRKISFDLNSGLLVNYKHFYAGATVFHINQPDIGFYGTYRLPSRFVAHVTYNWLFSNKMLLNIGTQFSSQNHYQQLKLNFNALLYKHLLIALSYGTGEFVYGSIGYRNNFFSINFGRAETVSRLIGNQLAAYDLNISYTVRNKEQRKTLTDIERW